MLSDKKIVGIFSKKDVSENSEEENRKASLQKKIEA